MRFYLFAFIIAVIPIYSQTGPGGIGNTDGSSNLVLWLDADEVSGVNGTTITTWNDQSGNSNNFTVGNGAVFNTSTVNGYPAFNFNGTSHYFERAYTASLNPANFTVIAADNVTSSTNYKAVISNRDDPAGATANGFILYSRPTTDRWEFWTGINTGWNTGASSISTAGNWSNQLIRFRNNNNSKQLFIDGGRRFNGTISMNLNTVRPFRIGAGQNESTPNFYYSGDIGEIIMFDRFINNTQRIIIDNYLAAKYNYTLSLRDYYTQDNSGNGNFDHDVAGIGQNSDGTSHTNSQGTGIIRINNPSSLADDDFLFWGEETKAPTYDFTTNTSDYQERLNSKWRVSKRNDLGTVSVSVAASDLDLTGKQPCAALNLIVSNSSTFAAKTSYPMTLSSGIYTATAISFSDADYFTLEYQDLIVLDGTQFYNGSGSANRPDTTDGCYKLLVKNTATGTLTLTADSVVREVEVENGGKLVIDNGLKLEVADAVQLNGEIRLIGNSQLLQTHTGASQVTGTGSLYMDKQGKLTDVYQSGYWSSPVVTSGSTYTISGALKDGTTVTSATSTPPNITFINGHDGATTTPITLSRRWLASFVDSDEFNVHRNENQTFNPGEGFNMKSPGNATGQNYTFVGKPNDGDYSSSITYGYFSLLGNPYPSVMDSDQFLSDNSAVLNTLYFWDGENDNSTTHIRNSYQGGYATYVSGMGTPFGVGTTPNQYVSVGQGFFVYASATGTISFNNAQRDFNATSSFFGRSSGTSFPILRIGLDIELDNNKIYHRQLGVGFRGLTNGIDAGDAYMLDFQPSDFALVVNDTPGLFVITGIEDYSEAIEIPLRVYLDQQRNLTFKIDAIENFLPTSIFLKDAITNQFYDLENDVNITLPSGDYVNRFFITFNNGVLTTNNEISGKKNILIDDKGDSIKITSYDNKRIKRVRIYTLLGQLVLIKKEVNSLTIDLPIQVRGNQVLIVKVELGNGEVVTQKLIKK